LELVTTIGKDGQANPEQQLDSGSDDAAVQPQPGAPVDSSRSSSKLRALTELDEPSFERVRPSELFSASELTRPSSPAPAANDNAAAPRALASLAPPAADEADGGDELAGLEVNKPPTSDQATVQDSDANQLNESEPQTLTAHTSVEPNLATRAHTHVDQRAWFDFTLDVPGSSASPIDARQRLAWRFKAAFSSYKLLLPTAPTPEARAVMVNALRGYERLLRNAAGAPREGALQVTEALHVQLTEQQCVEMDRAMSEFEGALLTLDECLTNDQFRTRFSKQHVQPKLLLRYARFLASRRFGIGYRRDRFESLAQELLTAKLPSGKLLLMPRKRAAPVLQQLLRGLHRPSVSPDALEGQLSYLRDALDRLENIAGPKQFFDSGFYLDLYGYKISMHERITSPEFLYLCVALNVEVHNRLLQWSESGGAVNKLGGAGAAAGLQVQLRAQQEAAQAVFNDFHRPLAGRAGNGRATGARKLAKPVKKEIAAPASGRGLKLMAAALFLVMAVVANLITTGILRFDHPPRPLDAERLHALSPLLQSAKLSADGKHLSGAVARPSWRRLSPRERQDAAHKLADALKAQGIDHAEVLAYKSRAIQVDYGSVVYVDDAK
jgi:hypothetical protein